MNTKILPAGMDPMEVGRRVLRGIRHNDLYIQTHPEYESGIRERFEALLASVPRERAPPAARVAAEAVVLSNPLFVQERERQLLGRRQPGARKRRSASAGSAQPRRKGRAARPTLAANAAKFPKVARRPARLATALTQGLKEHPMQQLAGKVAFITGGRSGIGLGLAQVFAGAGMQVVIADVREDHLESALATLKASGAVAHGIRLDVSDRAAFGRTAQETLKLHDKVHLLCNNAGVSIFGPMEAATGDDWDWIMGVNVGGVINGLQSFVPHLRSHGEGGHVVNTASTAGLLVGPGMGLYWAFNFAVVGLTHSLRFDLGPHGIGVSVLCPGFVRSNIHEAVLSRPKHLAQTGYRVAEEDRKRLDPLLSVGMTPLDVAKAVWRGVERNDLWILPHAEFAAELCAEFDRILAALSDAAPDSAHEGRGPASSAQAGCERARESQVNPARLVTRRPTS